MPLGPGVRYRWKDGVRLAFRGNKVIETKKKGEQAKLVKGARESRGKR